MTESNSSERVVHTIDGGAYDWVSVEHEDWFDKADDPDAPPKEMRYKRVEILENGWTRCVTPDDEENRGVPDDETCVDYFPPERVNQIRTVMEDE